MSGKRYYTITCDGFEEFDSAEKAENHAASVLAECREDAASDGEWPDDVDCIEWGEIVPRERSTAHEENNGTEYTLDEVTP